MMFLVEAAVIFCLGAYLWSFPIKMWREVRKIRELPQIDAVILKNEILEFIEPMAGNDDKLFQPRITYLAYVNGQRITSRTLCPDKEAYKYVNRMHAIASANCYPVNSVVRARLISSGTEPELMLTAELDWPRQSHYLAWAIFAVLICLVGIGLAWIRFPTG